GSEKGIGDGRSDRGHRDLANAARRFVIFNKLDENLGRRGENGKTQPVKVARRRQATLDADRFAERTRNAPDDPAFDLLPNDIRMDHPAAIDDRDDPIEHDPLAILDMQFYQHGNMRSETTMRREALAAARYAALPIAQRRDGRQASREPRCSAKQLHAV